MKLEIEVSDDAVCGLLCSALDASVGSSYYWIHGKRTNLDDVNPLEFPDYFSAEALENWKEYRFFLLPFVPLGEIVFTVLEDESDEYSGKDYVLNRASLERGLNVMVSKYPRHMSDVLKENGDAETGDVFLQCCLFGEIVYG